MATRGRTARYYAANPEAREKRLKQQSRLNKTDKERKKRVELNRANREAGTYGNGDNLDMSHTRGGKMVKEHYRTNRARNGANGKTTKK
jgi:hypothetical protein